MSYYSVGRSKRIHLDLELFMNLSVLLATFNRAEMLQETLQHFRRLDFSGLNVQFVVIDNNSSDDTRRVVKSWQKCLPLLYCFVPRPGKSNALNYALESLSLHEIIVFTDDDISPRPDWLQVITHMAATHRDYDVFGGSIYPIWPEGPIPKWTRSSFIRKNGFSQHQMCPAENVVIYPPGALPCGANFWIRNSILQKKYRFNPNFGPQPVRKTLGGESSFLLTLHDDGFKMLHVPAAEVGHRIKSSEMSLHYVVRRMHIRARSNPRLGGLQNMALFVKSPMLWRLYIMSKLAGNLARGAFFWIPGKDETPVGNFFRIYSGLLRDFKQLMFSITSPPSP